MGTTKIHLMMFHPINVTVITTALVGTSRHLLLYSKMYYSAVQAITYDGWVSEIPS